MLSITKQISKYNHSNRNGIQYLVIHDTGCPTTDTAKNNADYFGGGNRGSSAHYFVDANSIYQVVEENQASWHCGDGKNAYGISNRNSLGIEMCKTNGIVANATIKNTLDLIRFLMAKYKIAVDKVVRHYDASRKICPEFLSDNNWSKWYDFKKQLGSASVSPKSKVNYCLGWQKFYNEKTKTTTPLVCDGCYGKLTQDSINALLGYIKQGKKYKYCLEFQKWYNTITQTKAPLVEDGLWNNSTAKAIETINNIVKKNI